MYQSPLYNAPAEQIVEVVGLGRRLVAYIIDAVILGVVGAVMGFMLGFVAAVLLGTGPEATSTAQLFSYCMGLVLNSIFYVLFWATTGQTPGKMLLSIRIVRDDGSALGVSTALIRYIGYIVSGLFLGLGFVWPAFDERRQGWHDKIAGTYVVHNSTHFSGREGIQFVRRESISSMAFVVLAALFFCIIPVGMIALLTILGSQVGSVMSEVNQGLR